MLLSLTRAFKNITERDASSRFDVLAKVAEEMKGKGTIAYINCG